jgi:hypothetical protein
VRLDQALCRGINSRISLGDATLGSNSGLGTKMDRKEPTRVYQRLRDSASFHCTLIEETIHRERHRAQQADRG